MSAISATIAARMTSADIVKIRKRRGTLIWAFVLTFLPLLLYFVIAAAQHSSNPQEHGPAGGLSGFQDSLRIVALFFGPLAAILIGTDAGAGDVAAGVFRDLVVTGRSRVVLFATRVPAALCLSWLVVVVGYVIILIGTFAFSSGTATPSASLLANGFGLAILSTGVICAVAVGFAALTGSRPAALVALIGWQLIASRILENIESLGNSRKLILSQAIVHFSPIGVGIRHRGPRVSEVVTMSGGTAVLVMIVWLVVFLSLGAWRTRTMDA